MARILSIVRCRLKDEGGGTREADEDNPGISKSWDILRISQDFKISRDILTISTYPGQRGYRK